MELRQTTYYAFLSYDVGSQEEGTITDFADGTVELVLSDDSGPDEVALVLEPDIYQIDLIVVAREF